MSGPRLATEKREFPARPARTYHQGDLRMGGRDERRISGLNAE